MAVFIQLLLVCEVGLHGYEYLLMKILLRLSELVVYLLKSGLNADIWRICAVIALVVRGEEMYDCSI